MYCKLYPAPSNITHTYALAQTQRQIEAVRQHEEIRFLSNLWIPLLILLVSISPRSCSGACAVRNSNRALTLTLTLSHINLDPHIVTFSPSLFQ